MGKKKSKIGVIACAPTVTGGPRLQVTVIKKLTFGCPKCETKIDLTGVKCGEAIACPECKNVTWAPAVDIKWWHSTKMFIGTLMVAVITGVLGKGLTDFVWQLLKGTTP